MSVSTPILITLSEICACAAPRSAIRNCHRDQRSFPWHSLQLSFVNGAVAEKS